MWAEAPRAAYLRGFDSATAWASTCRRERGTLRSGRWGDLALSRIGIGQGVGRDPACKDAQTPNCAIANGGRLNAPLCHRADP